MYRKMCRLRAVTLTRGDVSRLGNAVIILVRFILPISILLMLMQLLSFLDWIKVPGREFRQILYVALVILLISVCTEYILTPPVWKSRRGQDTFLFHSFIAIKRACSHGQREQKDGTGPRRQL